MRVIVAADGESSKYSPIKLFGLINLSAVPLQCTDVSSLVQNVITNSSGVFEIAQSSF